MALAHEDFRSETVGEQLWKDLRSISVKKEFLNSVSKRQLNTLIISLLHRLKINIILQQFNQNITQDFTHPTVSESKNRWKQLFQLANGILDSFQQKANTHILHSD